MKKLRALSLLVLFALTFVAAPRIGAQTSSPVIGVGNFSHIVENLDRSLAFYRDVLGLTPANSVAWANTPAIMQLDATPGAQSRMAALRIPGSQLGIELIECHPAEARARGREDPPSCAIPTTCCSS